MVVSAGNSLQSLSNSYSQAYLLHKFAKLIFVRNKVIDIKLCQSYVGKCQNGLTEVYIDTNLSQ